MSHWYPLAAPTIGDAEIDAAAKVLRSGHTTMGDRVAEFEEKFAQYVGSPHAVMVNSGSSADMLIARAANAREVILPAVTWPTHVWSWKMTGAHVTLADVDGLNVTAETLKEVVTDWTDAISVAHLMGAPCDMPAINQLARSNGAIVTEDCCEALGAHIGRAGDAAWSFFFSHHITTMEGGMITTFSSEHADEYRSLRSHGWDRHRPDGGQYTFVDWGYNVRPTEVAAAIGLVQLEQLPTMLTSRAKNRATFYEVLKDSPYIEIPEAAGASWFGIPMIINGDRDALAVWLENHGVETRPILAGNLARQPVAQKHPLPHGDLPGADRIHDHGLYIGLHASARYPAARVAELIKAHYQC